jgi:hypothetical protein
MVFYWTANWIGASWPHPVNRFRMAHNPNEINCYALNQGNRGGIEDVSKLKYLHFKQ